ncbi:MAG: N-acetylmuramoyl-L-alanine amidase [Lachnospiraceae bacterium]
MKKRKWFELSMTIMLLLGVWALSREAASLVQTASADKKVILIDIGHGGIDPGVIGIDGLKEKDINLKIAKELKKQLEKKNFQVVMTREKDEGLYDKDSKNKKVQDLQKRCEIIKNTQPVLTVSIHQNSYQQESVCGPQVFYYTHSVEGAKLAKCIQDELNVQLEIEKPRTEKANSTYYLLKRSEGVLTIVETGFLTNTKEAKLLDTKAYQRKVAKAICQGIEVYLEGKV